MKNSILYISLVILFLSLFCSLPVFAAARADVNTNSKHQEDSYHFKKKRKRSFQKTVWPLFFQKKQLHLKTSSNEARFSFGLGALIAVAIAAIATLFSAFWAPGLTTWGASIVLGVLGLFKDRNKALSIIALALALALPFGILILFALNCCEP